MSKKGESKSSSAPKLQKDEPKELEDISEKSRVEGVAGSSGSVELGFLAKAFEALQEVANEPFAIKVSVKIIQLHRWLEPLYTRYHKARLVEAGKFGKESGEGKQILIIPERVSEFNQAMAPINAERIDVDPTMLLTLDDLEGTKISPFVLARLEPVIMGI